MSEVLDIKDIREVETRFLTASTAQVQQGGSIESGYFCRW